MLAGGRTQQRGQAAAEATAVVGLHAPNGGVHLPEEGRHGDAARRVAPVHDRGEGVGQAPADLGAGGFIDGRNVGAEYAAVPPFGQRQGAAHLADRLQLVGGLVDPFLASLQGVLVVLLAGTGRQRLPQLLDGIWGLGGRPR